MQKTSCIKHFCGDDIVTVQFTLRTTVLSTKSSITKKEKKLHKMIALMP